MSAYVIVDIDIHDPQTYEGYMTMSPVSVAAYGGRFVARGGKTEKLEGDWVPKRLVILEFENMERAKQWLDSPEYAPAKAIRHKAAHSNMVLVQGV